MRSWFRIENSLVDRDDLGAYEKLCCIIVARYAGRPEFNHLITVRTIAKKMGVDELIAKRALQGLVDKGLITEEFSNSIDLDDNFQTSESVHVTSNLISRKNTPDVQLMQMPNLDDDKSELVEEEKIISAGNKDSELALKKVMDIIKEPINARQGRIILGLANNDIEKVRSCYNKSMAFLGDGRIDALIECLQRKQPNSDPSETQGEIRDKIGGQVNRIRLEQMKKYSNFSKKNNE